MGLIYNGWVVKELLKDGYWVRSAQAHVWEKNRDAHQQRDELAKRYPDRTYAVARFRVGGFKNAPTKGEQT
jgi:hypothetical protein